MPNLEVVFQVPQQILNGLLSGQLERVDGIIRNSMSKEVVVWLREANVLDNIGGSLPQPLNLILNAARASITLYDGQLTRTAIGGLSEQVVQLNQQMKWVTSLSTFVVGGQVLNFALTAVSLYATLQKLNQLSEEINHLGEIIRAEFNWDRNMSFQKALDAARDVFEMDASNSRDNAANTAIYDLNMAKENFLAEYDQMIKNHLTFDNLLLAKHYLIRAMYAQTCRIHCYLVIGQTKIARSRLKEDIPKFRAATIRLVNQFVGQKPALYFYKDVDASDLDRFLQIQRWVKSPDDISANDVFTLFDVVNRLRGDFWDPAIIQEEYSDTLSRLINRPISTVATQISKIPEQLSNAEIMIENYQRLLGFEDELRTMRLSFSDWNNLVQEEDLNQHIFAMVIDRDQLDQMQAK